MKVGDGYKYQKGTTYVANQMLTISGETYYFDSNGYRVTGFKSIGGKTYYFDANGKRLYRWKRINNKKYYFDPVDGHMHTGWEWVEENDAWYYLSTKYGYLLEGWISVGGKMYYLTPVDFYAKTGWQTINGKKYYFDRCLHVHRLADDRRQKILFRNKRRHGDRNADDQRSGLYL